MDEAMIDRIKDWLFLLALILISPLVPAGMLWDKISHWRHK